MNARHASLLIGLLALGSTACTIGNGSQDDTSPTEDPNAVVDETAVAGANQNDRSASRDGEELLTGAMVVSPSGRFIVMQRNTVTLVYDVTSATYREIATPFSRVAFSKSADVVFAFSADGMLRAIDLASLSQRWSASLGATSTLLRLSDDDATLLFGDGLTIRIIDAATGTVKGSAEVPQASYAAF